MPWIERVPSVRYQAMNTAISPTKNTVVVDTRLTPRLSVRLSVTRVPTTLTRTTTVQ